MHLAALRVEQQIDGLSDGACHFKLKSAVGLSERLMICVDARLNKLAVEDPGDRRLRENFLFHESAVHSCEPCEVDEDELLFFARTGERAIVVIGHDPVLRLALFKLAAKGYEERVVRVGRDNRRHDLV